MLPYGATVATSGLFLNAFEKCVTDQNRDRKGAETERTDCGSGNRFLTGAVLNKLFKHALTTR